MRAGQGRRWGLLALVLGAACGGQAHGPGVRPGPPALQARGPQVSARLVQAGSAGWRLLGPESGAPLEARGVTLDAGGNLWVAGGEEGLFLLRAGERHFERFTGEDGLHLFGLGRPGAARPLRVSAVAGGGPGTVYVGYEDAGGCAQGSAAADRVTLTPTGLRVVHYELVAGRPSGSVPAPPGACTVRRIAYEAAHRFVWFAAGEGFAWGAVDDEEDGASSAPALQVAGVQVPLPPCATPPTARCSVAPGDGAGGREGLAGVGLALRSTRFRLVSGRGPSPSLQRVVAGSEGWGVQVNRIDMWPPLAPGAAGPGLEQQVDAWASALAPQEEAGAAWPGALLGRLLHRDVEGRLLGQLLSAPSAAQVTALARDPRDDSLWVGQAAGRGLLRLQAGRTVAYAGALGALGGQHVWDIQVVGEGRGRRVLVAFGGGPGRPGGVGIYSGED